MLKLITKNPEHSTNLNQKKILKYFEISFMKQQKHKFKISFSSPTPLPFYSILAS